MCALIMAEWYQTLVVLVVILLQQFTVHRLLPATSARNILLAE